MATEQDLSAVGAAHSHQEATAPMPPSVSVETGNYTMQSPDDRELTDACVKMVLGFIKAGREEELETALKPRIRRDMIPEAANWLCELIDVVRALVAQHGLPAVLKRGIVIRQKPITQAKGEHHVS